MGKRGSGVFAIAILALCLVFGCTVGVQSAHAATSETKSAQTQTTKTVQLMAVGDNLIHSQVYRACKTSNGYDFSPIYKHIKADAQAADLAVINQETILVSTSPSGYPCFGTPKKMAKALVNAGFNVATHATNHVMDRGSSNILGTLKIWKKRKQMTVLGIHKSKKAAKKITVVKKNGIKIAMLNYTYGLNGFSLPSGKKYLVDLLDSSHKAKIKSDIKRAKKKADFVIVFPHWGTEYKLTPDSFQKKWAKFFANQGVDLVIGTHPHVLEPVKVVKGKKGHKMVCYYSLGNFVSYQHDPETLLGGMAKVRIVKDKKGTRIKSYKIKPLVTHVTYGKKFTVYKLSDYTPKLAAGNYIHHRNPSATFTVKSLKRLFKRIVG